MIAVILYAIVSLVLMLRLFWGYGFLFRLRRQGEKLNYKGLHVIKVSNQQISPFSFFRTIFIPEYLEEKSDKQLVLEHEKTHCDQWHSVDRSLVEWILIFHWWNPFAWWLRKLIAQNHEYCVDNAMIRQSAQAKTYQYSLIHLMPGKQSMRLVNNFNRKLTKKRIVMMNKANTNRFIGWIKVVLIVPLFGMMLLAFTDPDKSVDGQQKKDTPTSIKDSQELREFLARNIKYPHDAQKVGLQGEVIAHISVNKDGQPGKPVRGNASGNNVVKMDEVVVVSYNKNTDGKHYSESEKKAAREMLEGEMDRVLRSLPTITNVNWRGKTLELKFVFMLQDSPQKDKALYFIDEEEVSEKVVELLDTKRIQSMNVLKGTDATEKYGDRASVGAIEISTKEKSQEGSRIRIKGNGGENSPLFVVDGKKMAEISGINPEEIESIEVLKGKEAVVAYGDEAESGVVIVSSKAESDENEPGAEVIRIKRQDTSSPGSIIKIKGQGSKNQPLYIVDGKELSHAELEKIRSVDIEEVTVLKEKNATDKYGEKGKNGVILLDLKKEHQ